MDDSEELRRPRVQTLIVDLFHQLYYHSPDTWPKNTFLGYPIMQCPLDLHLYQEVVFQRRPSFILQTGVMHGGSVLYFACLLDLIGADPSAVVVGIDIGWTEMAETLRHPRIRLIQGNSTSPRTVEAARAVLPPGRGMVVLDSDHHQQHVLDELRIYREFVAPGSTSSPRTPTSTGTRSLRATVQARSRPSGSSWAKTAISSATMTCGSDSFFHSTNMGGSSESCHQLTRTPVPGCANSHRSAQSAVANLKSTTSAGAIAPAKSHERPRYERPASPRIWISQVQRLAQEPGARN